MGKITPQPYQNLSDIELKNRFAHFMAQRQQEKINLRKQDIKDRPKILLITFGIIANITLTVLMMLSTVLTIKGYILYVCLCSLLFFLMFLITKKFKHLSTRIFFSFFLGSALFNFLLLINYCFSETLPSETYNYTLLDSDQGQYYVSSVLQLEHDAYLSYPNIRYLATQNQNTPLVGVITFHFKEGVLGLKVLKSYQMSEPN